ncbi:hypothetical protein HYH03_008625 [Edaphochlamys debaryana]|uniref:Carbonic anhydrase n=1 Tax=Edaphochlamys debaryana TaxID=47281 RepID=A0A835Y664_9CHLO|nr:hypothetical protein HYH03_008625 [Edaphochlamys debaryana]|eukprot:KAG2493205.1 hypothetical protein HYH03_008625 [Edaphochlamys debaryana]
MSFSNPALRSLREAQQAFRDLPGSDLDSPANSPVARYSMEARRSMEVDPLNKLLRKNRAWSDARVAEDPAYFDRLCDQQAPEYFWIGCSDSRVPANAILGLDPGEVFVQRNVGNQATHTDLNGMSCLEYAVKELKVRNVIVCGHYGCGAVKAAIKMPSKTQNLVNCWISDIRQCRNEHRDELVALASVEAQVDRLCELNVLRQTFNVCTSPSVQSAWDKGQQLFIYGVVYALRDGLIKKLVGPISKNGDFEQNQALFAESGASYIPTADAGALEKAAANSSSPVPVPASEAAQAASPSGGAAMSFRSRMDAFNAYMNTMEVSSRIAEHVGWTEHPHPDSPGRGGHGGQGDHGSATATSAEETWH